MHHFIYPTKDSWISSGSITGSGATNQPGIVKPLTEQNYGKDEILELRKNFYNLTFDYSTRMLVQFDLTSISKSIENLMSTNEEIIPNADIDVGSKFYLRLYEAEGNKELSSNYGITAHAVSESWDEGRGKFGSTPQVTDGVSWNYRKWPTGGSGIGWTTSGSSYISASMIGGSVSVVASQSFSSSKPDIEMNVTDIIVPMLSSSQTYLADGADGTEDDMTKRIRNNGIILRFTGSQETDSETFGQLKFFSSNTNTIYSPKLEFRWDDHIPATGSNTGSLLQITSSGAADNYIYPIGLRESYKEDEKVKFRFGARKRYIQKTLIHLFKKYLDLSFHSIVVVIQ